MCGVSMSMIWAAVHRSVDIYEFGQSGDVGKSIMGFVYCTMCDRRFVLTIYDGWLCAIWLKVSIRCVFLVWIMKSMMDWPYAGLCLVMGDNMR